MTLFFLKNTELCARSCRSLDSLISGLVQYLGKQNNTGGRGVPVGVPPSGGLRPSASWRRVSNLSGFNVPVAPLSPATPQRLKQACNPSSRGRGHRL